MSELASKVVSLPPTLPGFEQIGRSWDAKNERCSARVLPGEYYVTRHDEIISTVLGSCVSACIRDPGTGVGGMNHFMLPGSFENPKAQWNGGDDSLETRFGVAAMESLINDILKQGARKGNLEVKLFGAGEILNMQVNNVGARNAAFVRHFVKLESMFVAAEDLGGQHPRKILYFPRTGKVLVRRLRSLQTQTVAAREQQYESGLLKQDTSSGEIELFD